MNDTVTRVMKHADNYALLNRISPSDAATFAARQALEAELTRLFTPLSDEQIKAMYHELCNSVGSSYQTIARATEAAHGIGETK